MTKFVKCKNSGPVPIPGTKEFLQDGQVIEGDYWHTLVPLGYVEVLIEPAFTQPEAKGPVDGGIIISKEKHQDGGVIIANPAADKYPDTGIIVTKSQVIETTPDPKADPKKAKGPAKKEKVSHKLAKSDKIDSNDQPDQENLDGVNDGASNQGVD